MKNKLLKIFLGIIVLLSVGAWYLISPSGNIDDYRAYFTDDTSTPKDSSVKVTFFGVSTLLFDDGETQILIDGFFSRPSIWAVLTSNISSDTTLISNIISQYKMDRVKGIFTTHSHYDHAFDVAFVAKKTNSPLFGSLSTLNIARGGGLKDKQMQEYKPYQKFELGKFSVQIIPSVHSQPNSLADDGVEILQPLSQPVNFKKLSEGGSYDFLISHKGKNIFVKASPNFKEGILDTVRADYVFMGIPTVGKKEVAWQNKFYKQTVGKLKPKLLVPIHWDEFMKPLSKDLVMLPNYADKTYKSFDFMIERTKKDKIAFKILQGTKSIVLF